MKRLTSHHTLAVLLAVLLAGLLATTALAVPDVFRGAWESIDIDGSYQVMTIGGGGGTYRVNYMDTGATVCGLDPDTGDFLYAAQARGTASASPGTGELNGVWDVWCLSKPRTLSVSGLPFTFTFDPSTGTLVDNFGVVWTRR